MKIILGFAILICILMTAIILQPNPKQDKHIVSMVDEIFNGKCEVFDQHGDKITNAFKTKYRNEYKNRNYIAISQVIENKNIDAICNR